MAASSASTAPASSSGRACYQSFLAECAGFSLGALEAPYAETACTAGSDCEQLVALLEQERAAIDAAAAREEGSWVGAVGSKQRLELLKTVRDNLQALASTDELANMLSRCAAAAGCGTSNVSAVPSDPDQCTAEEMASAVRDTVGAYARLAAQRPSADEAQSSDATATLAEVLKASANPAEER